MAPVASSSDLSRQRQDEAEDRPLGLSAILEALDGLTSRMERKCESLVAAITKEMRSVIRQPVETDPESDVSASTVQSTTAIDDIEHEAPHDDIDSGTVYFGSSATCFEEFTSVPHAVESARMAIAMKPMPLWEVIHSRTVVEGITGGLVVHVNVGMRLDMRLGMVMVPMIMLACMPFSAPESTITAW